MDLSDVDIDQANERGAKQRRSRFAAVAARYDRGRGRIVLRLNNGLEVMFAPSDAEGLAGARAEQLACIELSGGGLGLHFPLLDADFSVPAMLEGRFGSDRWMQARRQSRPAA